MTIRSMSAVLACALLAACAGSSTLVPPEEPYVVGPVESISHHATASSLLVRAGPGSREPCGISATVDASTRYYQRSAGSLQPITLARIAVGDTVEVHVEGPVAESCPVQGYAATIVRVPNTRS